MSVPEHDPDCLLCKAERLTIWHHEDDVCWVADCFQCRTPMVVWKRHGTEPSEDDRRHMLDLVQRIGLERLGTCNGGVWIDGDMRSIPNHFHAHARPDGGFFGPGGRPRSLDELR